ncbi:MAG: hypothetical protein HY684_04370 [Chloroflexi bacterium]|nr:hypothetical protein [Chloroflexota bacterium]
MRRKRSISRLALPGLLLLALLLALSPPVSAAQSGAAEDGRASSNPRESAISLTPPRGPAGSVTTVRGSGFDPNATLDILWQDWNGAWNIQNGSFQGREFREELTSIGRVRTDASGGFETTFKVPEGFGFNHDVLVTQGSTVRSKSVFFVEMQVEMTPKEGPPGTPVTLELNGLGWQPHQRDWVLLYDNKFTGWISAVTTKGKARAVVTATGEPGKHILRIFESSYFPSLSMQQPAETVPPSWTFDFMVTRGQPVLPPPAEQQGPRPISGKAPADPKGPTIWLDPASGSVGSEVTAYGRGLPPNAEVDLQWLTELGPDPVVAGGVRSRASFPVGAGKTAGDGSLRWTFRVPEDVGRSHPVVLRRGDQALARAEFKVRPKANPMVPSSGPVGTTITINLKGVDDTDTGKIFIIVYDNAWVGYACSVTSQGDITIYLQAAGEPGWHFIDLYPGMYEPIREEGAFDYNIYKGGGEEFYLFRIPQLTYAEDHPGEKDIPAFRFAFLVTDERN